MRYLSLLIVLILSFSKAQETIVWPPPPDKPKIKYIKEIKNIEDIEDKGFFTKLLDAVFGEKKKSMIKPYGLFIKNKTLYFTDTGARSLFIYDFKKSKLKIIDHIGDYALSSPIDVVVDDKGRIYISDSVLGTVFVTNEDGDLLGRIGSGKLLRPTGLAIDSKREKLFITDTLRSKIYIFSLKSRKVVKTIGRAGSEKGEFNRPTFLTVDKDGNIYVVDSMNARVQIFDKDGNFIRMFGERGTSIGTFANPRGIAVDSDGNIYVADTLLSAIQIFDKKGRLLLVVGYYGTRKGEFAFPADIAITPDNYIFVSDSYNMRIQVLKYLGGD